MKASHLSLLDGSHLLLFEDGNTIPFPATHLLKRYVKEKGIVLKTVVETYERPTSLSSQS